MDMYTCSWVSVMRCVCGCDCIHLCACAGICCISRVARGLWECELGGGGIGGWRGPGKFHRARRSRSALWNRRMMKTRGRVSVYDLISHSCFERLNIVQYGALVWPRMLLIDFTLASHQFLCIKINGNTRRICCSVNHSETSKQH